MREIPDVSIQEPPVKELKKRRSCLKRSCTSGCGCIIIFFFAILVLLNLLTGSGYKEVKEVPEVFPSDIELYEAGRTDTIKRSDRPVRGGVANAIAIIPKSFLASTYLVLGEDSPNAIGKYYETITFEEESNWHQFWRLMKEPITPDTNKIEITWRYLDAEPKFIQSFYTTNLEAAGYELTITADTRARRQILFEKDMILGSILIRDASADDPGTDYVVLSLSIPYE